MTRQHHDLRLTQRKLLLACAAPAALLFATPALAADAAAATAATATDGGPALEEVIVTARKRAENIQNIPVAVTAVSAQKLDNFGLRNLEGIAASIPQL